MIDEEEGEEEIFEEKVEIPEKERIKQILVSANLQKELEDFLGMEVTPENIKFLKIGLDKDYFHIISSINDLINRLLNKLSIHPDLKKYFKLVMEKKEKEKEIEKLKIYDLTEVDHIELERDVIEIMRDMLPKMLLLIELQRTGIEKYNSYIFSEEPSMVVQGVKSFGKGRCETAYELYKQGKGYPEIAKAIGVSPKQAQAYVTYWAKKVGDPEFVKEEEHAEEIPGPQGNSG
jgi:hypothetical protein